MFVAASSRCFEDKSIPEACQLLSDVGFDKIELWMDENSDHLKPSVVAAAPDRFYIQYREMTRMTPVGLCLENDPTMEVFEGLCRLAKMLKVTQITLPAAPIGTPFNEEIDRLRSRLAAANSSGIRLSLKTKTGFLTEDPQTAVELCQSVPGLGVTYDPSYFICSRFANQSHDQIFQYVYHTHQIGRASCRERV